MKEKNQLLQIHKLCAKGKVYVIIFDEETLALWISGSKRDLSQRRKLMEGTFFNIC